MSSQDASQRRFTADDLARPRPVHAVWEITLACDLKCAHCGSRAEHRRPAELTTEECIDLIDQLHQMGCREITLIGGEAYLRRDWTTLIAAIVERGIYCGVQTGARNLTPARIEAAWQAGLRHVGVSIDGIGETHDRQRGVPGSFDRAVEAIRNLHARGMRATVNSQINPLSRHQLPALLDLLVELGVTRWQLQLTVAMGRANDNTHLLLQPFELLEVIPEVAALVKDGAARGVSVQPGNNIGFFGPHEEVIRQNLGEAGTHWSGCAAGVGVLGLEADGTIKGCPSLTTAEYGGGNIRDRSLREVWEQAPELAFARARTRDDLGGFCRTCYYAEVCQAGCTWTHQVLTGVAGDNPFCHHRVETLANQNLRERLVQRAPAPGAPFDRASWELLPERLDGSPTSPDELPIQDPAASAWRADLPKQLRPCGGCRRFFQSEATSCPFCQRERQIDDRPPEEALSDILMRLYKHMQTPSGA